jgi:hypothetical protein
MYAQSGSVHAREPTVALLTAALIAAGCTVIAWYIHSIAEKTSGVYMQM